MESVKAIIKGCDMFGLPVALTYKGEGKFKTAIGGCVSMVIILATIVYAAFQLNILAREPTF